MALGPGSGVRALVLLPGVVTCLLAAGAVWLAVSVLVNGALPGAVQTYVVKPNELQLEREYLAHNIQATREAFLHHLDPRLDLLLGDTAGEQLLGAPVEFTQQSGLPSGPDVRADGANIGHGQHQE